MEDIRIQSFEVDGEFDQYRIDKYLSIIYEGQSRTFFQKLIKDGHVLVNDLPITKNSYAVAAGDIVTVEIPAVQSVDILAENIPLDILYEDSDVLIVNKPKDMVVHPSAGHYTGTLVNAIMYHCEQSLSGINGVVRPGIVHRIDKDTTGSLIVCKNDQAHMDIAEQIKVHSVNRIYHGIVFGKFKDQEGQIDNYLARDPKNRKKMAVCAPGQGKQAVTHYKVLKTFNNYSYVQFKLETGRTHQIRVHMASIGHPLLGDTVYGPEKQPFKGLQGQTLHAKIIGFVHPNTKEYVEFDAALPTYFEELLEKLERMG